MVVERADILIKSGQQAEFEAAMKHGVSLLATGVGAGRISLSRCVERSDRYMLQIEWQSIADHQSFTDTPAFKQFRELAAPFFCERPAMEHYELL